MKNILAEANKIINERSEEKERLYGPFIECNRKAAEISSILCGKEITTEDIYKFQISLKLARESHTHKEDNLLDLVAYVGALNNFHNNVEPEMEEEIAFIKWLESIDRNKLSNKHFSRILPWQITQEDWKRIWKEEDCHEH